MSVAVSIVLPVFNAEPFLGAALRSILPELADDVELVVVDDGSTDGSADRLASLSRHDRVQVVQQANQGLPAALRRGISLARAPLIARMDADDVNVPGRIGAARRLLEERPEIGLVSCWADVIDHQDRLVRQFQVPWLADDVERHLRFVGNNVVHGAAVFRRETYDLAGGYRDGVIAEDYDLWLRMTAHRGLSIVPERRYRYRTHRRSVTGRSRTAIVEAARSLMDAHWRDLNALAVPHWSEARDRHRWYVRNAGPASGNAYFDSLRGLAGEARLRGSRSVLARSLWALVAADPGRLCRDLGGRVPAGRQLLGLDR